MYRRRKSGKSGKQTRTRELCSQIRGQAGGGGSPSAAWQVLTAFAKNLMKRTVLFQLILKLWCHSMFCFLWEIICDPCSLTPRYVQRATQ